MARSPRNSYGAGAAMSRAARRLFSAFDAMLWILRGGVQFAPVYGLMAGDANRDSIINVNDSFGMLRDRFNMMGVELPAVPAPPTLEPVSLKNRNAPLGKVAFGSGSAPVEAMPALPCTGLFSYTGTPSTRTRAEHGGFIAACKGISAPCTKFFNRRIPMRPAHFTTIPGRFGAICLDMIRQSTNFASLYFTGVFHDLIMPCNKDKCKLFIVRMTDAFPDIKIKRIKEA